jgi:hypothetical protein
MFLRVFIFYYITKNLQILHFDPYTSILRWSCILLYCRVIMSSYRVGLTCKLCCRLFLNIGEKKLTVILTFYTRHSVTYMNTLNRLICSIFPKEIKTHDKQYYFPVCTNEVIVHSISIIILFHLFFLLWALSAVHTMQFSLPPSLIISDSHCKEISIYVFPEKDLRGLSPISTFTCRGPIVQWEYTYKSYTETWV